MSAPHERAWSLLSSPEAWSLQREPTCVFDIPARQPDAVAGEWLRFCVAADASGQVSGMPLELDGSEEGWQLGVRTPGGDRTWRLQGAPTRRGTRLRIAGTVKTRRDLLVEAEAQERERAASWLKQVEAVLDGAMPWPPPGVPGPLRSRALAVSQPQGALEASASVHLAVPLADAGRLMRAPEVIAAAQAAAGQPAGVLWTGRPPGDTPGEVGSLSCTAVQMPAGALSGIVAVCVDASPTHYVMRQLHWPFDQASREVIAAGDESQLVLRQRVLPRTAELTPEDVQARLAASLTQAADQLKVAIEDAAAAGS